MSDRDRKARRAVKALVIVAWLLGGGTALLAREHETAFAWFAGVTAVVLVFTALAVAAGASAESEKSGAEVSERRISIRRTVTTSEGKVIEVTADNDEIHP